MKNFKFRTLFILCTFLSLSLTAYSQTTARLQVIHNSPTPTVDIYVNGARLLDNFAFRTATPYIDVPAGIQLSIAVALASSTSVADALATYRVTFEVGKRYIAIAYGALGNTQTPFNLGVWDFGKETTTANNVDVAFFHGALAAPAVDILTGGNVVFGNTSFGQFARPTMPYATLPANANYELSVTPAGASTTVVGKYNLNLGFWAGKTAIVIATGMLGSTNPNMRFEPWVVLSNGGTLPLSALPTTTNPPRTARLQIIHNSPTPTVDVYVNGDRLLDNFAFRTATPYVEVPAGVVLNVGVAGAASTSVRDTLANFPIRLDSGKTYIVIANGVLGNATRPFRLVATDKGRMRSANAENVDIAFFHGSPDAPAVDIRTGGNVLFGNVSFGNFADYISVPANPTYTLGVTPAGNATTVVARYLANLSFWKGQSAVVFASGFLTGGTPGFEPWVALSNGGTFPLGVAPNAFEVESVSVAKKQIVSDELQISPNPIQDNALIEFGLQTDSKVTLQVMNLAGQVVKTQQLGTMQAGKNQFSMTTNDLEKGYYVLRLQSDNETMTKKMVVMR